MEQTTAKPTVAHRAQYVSQSAQIFASSMGPTIGIVELERFATHAEGTAHEKSREYTDHFKDDDDVLTDHANHMRSVAANILVLRDGLVPALKVYPESPNFKRQAIGILAYLRAQFEAMDGLMK